MYALSDGVGIDCMIHRAHFAITLFFLLCKGKYFTMVYEKAYSDSLIAFQI